MIHWMSTTISSIAPVMMASSWLRKLPTVGTPWRISVSLAVQQMPARVMPLAPFDLAYSIISGSFTAATINSERVGSWPWTTIFTSSSLRAPMLAWAVSGTGEPNRMSVMSVESIEPPQPSARAFRSPAIRMLS